jgi:hypothetical protein
VYLYGTFCLRPGKRHGDGRAGTLRRKAVKQSERYASGDDSVNRDDTIAGTNAGVPCGAARYDIDHVEEVRRILLNVRAGTIERYRCRTVWNEAYGTRCVSKRDVIKPEDRFGKDTVGLGHHAFFATGIGNDDIAYGGSAADRKRR